MNFVITQIHKNHTFTQKFNKEFKSVSLILNEILDFLTVFQAPETLSHNNMTTLGYGYQIKIYINGFQ